MVPDESEDGGNNNTINTAQVIQQEMYIGTR